MQGVQRCVDGEEQSVLDPALHRPYLLPICVRLCIKVLPIRSASVCCSITFRPDLLVCMSCQERTSVKDVIILMDISIARFMMINGKITSTSRYSFFLSLRCLDAILQRSIHHRLFLDRRVQWSERELQLYVVFGSNKTTAGYLWFRSDFHRPRGLYHWVGRIALQNADDCLVFLPCFLHI